MYWKEEYGVDVATVGMQRDCYRVGRNEMECDEERETTSRRESIVLYLLLLYLIGMADAILLSKRRWRLHVREPQMPIVWQ